MDHSLGISKVFLPITAIAIIAIVAVLLTGVRIGMDEARVVTVRIPNGSASDNGKTLTPAIITITIGVNNTVRWINEDNRIHLILSGEPENPSGLFDSGIIRGGEEFLFTFTEPGEVKVFCTMHPWKTGTVIVNGS